jgi:hypothetical protein
VIDFRYHIVSIVAVFLALAIGIVLGSTELQGHTIDALNAASNSLSNQLNAARAQRDSYQTLAGAGEQYLQTAEPKLLGRLLDGQRVVLITEPGAQGSVVDGIKQAVIDADATVSGQLSLQPAFNDTSGATQSSLSSINGSVASSDDIQLNAGTDSQTADQQQAAQLIATAILEKTTSQSGSGLSATQAQTLLTAYGQAGYLSVTGTPAAPASRATLAVLVIPQNAPSDGANDPANQVLLAIAQEFATASAATVVAGSTAGSAQPGSAMSALRSSSVSGSVSSVDDADMALGQITVVDALASQLAGGKPNSYGISGASAVSPNPLPSVAPSATATASAQSHPKAGKGGKPVKNK